MNQCNVNDLILVDDDLDEVFIFELALDSVGFKGKLRHAEDGQKLFILLGHRTPDIIFLDINMPCKDGVSCIMEVRRNPLFNSVPVIMYTSWKRQQDIEDSYSRGANFYVTKAGTIGELEKKLGLILSIDWKAFVYLPTRSEFVIGEVS
jgi:DNA-binding response OmpR family regulator